MVNTVVLNNDGEIFVLRSVVSGPHLYSVGPGFISLYVLYFFGLSPTKTLSKLVVTASLLGAEHLRDRVTKCGGTFEI